MIIRAESKLNEFLLDVESKITSLHIVQMRNETQVLKILKKQNQNRRHKRKQTHWVTKCF